MLLVAWLMSAVLAVAARRGCVFGGLPLQMLVAAHQSVEAASNSMWMRLKRRNYVTPTNYLEAVRNYKALLAERRADIAGKANKLKGGLTKLDETSVQVGASGVRMPSLDQ